MKTTLRALKQVINESVSTMLVESGIYADDVRDYLEKAVPAATADELDAFTAAVSDDSMDGQLLSDEVKQMWPWLSVETADDIAADLFDILTHAWSPDPVTGKAYELAAMRGLRQNEATIKNRRCRCSASDCFHAGYDCHNQAGVALDDDREPLCDACADIQPSSIPDIPASQNWTCGDCGKTLPDLKSFKRHVDQHFPAGSKKSVKIKKGE